ncbi:MAG: hypothetical protein Q9176_002326 [Flavoplaca citrina]
MRGILELEILRAIELALVEKSRFRPSLISSWAQGMNLLTEYRSVPNPLASTGGIIALALGVKQWTINQCVTEFIRLSDQAFSPRPFKQVHGLEEATTLWHGSKYRTRPLRSALQSAFGEEPLYGGSRKAHLSYTTQVAVTATSATGEKSLVLANYSRHEESEPSYRFEFPHYLQIWEAASATSAAPSLFKPFTKIRSPCKTYLDGALYHNNPASVANNERKFLWPDVAENTPDILLSLGTGKHGRQLEEQIAEFNPPAGKQQPTTRSSNPDMPAKSKRRTKPKWKRGNSYKMFAKFFSVLVNRIDCILDAEMEWKRFRNEISDAKDGQGQESRFIRLNLDLGREPPKLDEKDRLAELQDLGSRLLKSDEYSSIIERIAHMLVASTFYFFKSRFWYNEDTGTWTCKGSIVCRFEGKLLESRSNMRALGDHLRHQQSPGYQPYFTVKDDVDGPDRHQIPITESMIEGMINRAEFRFSQPLDINVPSSLSSTTIYLNMRGIHNEQTSLYPISGFPRKLIAEDMINETRLDRRAELIKERRYGRLAVASDPKVAVSGRRDSAPETQAEDIQDSTNGDGKGTRLAKTGSAGLSPTTTATMTSARRKLPRPDSSRTLVSEKSHKSSSTSKSVGSRVSIKELRAQAQSAAQDGRDGRVMIEDGEKLAKTMSVALSLGSTDIGNGMEQPSFDSDDSDGPPEIEGVEMETEVDDIDQDDYGEKI